MLANFLAGGTAGTLQWFPPIYCFDVIKSRMQTAPQGTYSGIRDCARRMYAEGGVKVFFRCELIRIEVGR
jgi:solute carrier family 25 carnitine/acylcarnitine transporter 20/29